MAQNTSLSAPSKPGGATSTTSPSQVLVACTRLLAEGHRVWRSHHPPQARRSLPVSGLMQIQRLSLPRLCRLVQGQMSLTLTRSMVFPGACIIAREKVISYRRRPPQSSSLHVFAAIIMICVACLIDTFKLKVKPGKTYLLRLINAARNDELFFSIANHTVTVVETDANYVKPFDADTVLVTPGQTTNVVLHSNPTFPNATFLFAARPYATGQGTFDNTTTAGVLEYRNPIGLLSLIFFWT
ncbi:hypothetical protein BHE74_00042737 [Ensete ventricosum]|nr:hypothetical protein BHE74_00042737 [Ensete ventricosum]